MSRLKITSSTERAYAPRGGALDCPAIAAEEQLVRVLGPDWERMSWVQAAAFGRGRPLIDFAAEPQQPAGAKVRSIGNRPTHSQRRFYRSATPGNQRTNRKRTGRIAVVVPTEGDTGSRLSKGLMRRF